MTQNYFPWDETKEDNVLPTGDFHMVWSGLEQGESQTGKLMLRSVFQCKLPAEYAGMQHFEYFVLGSDENPQGVVPGAMGTRAFKKALIAAQIPPSSDLTQLVMSAVNSELILGMVEYTEKDGAYAGTPRNRISNYYRLGEREAKVTVVGGGVKAVAAPPAPPVQPQTTAAPPAPSQPVAATPVAPAPPVQPAAPTPPASPAPPAAASAGQVMRCTICQSDVPIAEFSAHVQAHMGQPAAG